MNFENKYISEYLKILPPDDNIATFLSASYLFQGVYLYIYIDRAFLYNFLFKTFRRDRL